METEVREVQHHFHVLAVDDSLIDRKLLEKLLTISSCEAVTCVESGDKALRYLGLLDDLDKFSSSAAANSFSSSQLSQQQEVKVNLIMTDYCMPGMSGYDLLKRLKGSYWKDIPVVVMSSENEPSRINMCLEEGAEEFLLKPLQLSDVKKLEPHLQKSLTLCSADQVKEEETTLAIEIGITDDENNSKLEGSKKNENSINNSLSKRKAATPEHCEERRPKLKELQAGV
ncbi:two-component response regulator ARR17-like isoform X1 [Benincasa hispida]|uniref:two-component response regulator ARR17-like isoform X1 n=1 Tax=Benincasa hispida TaxID=102211 RepID=UPI0019006526|nr:two-component response regulator ARR17-like isoform X1 [Benincasa hispida]